MGGWLRAEGCEIQGRWEVPESGWGWEVGRGLTGAACDSEDATPMEIPPRGPGQCSPASGSYSRKLLPGVCGLSGGVVKALGAARS